MNLNELGRLKAVEHRVAELDERLQRIEHMLQGFDELKKIVADLRYDDALPEV